VISSGFLIIWMDVREVDSSSLVEINGSLWVMSNYAGNLNFVSDNYSRVAFVILNFYC